MNLQNDHQKGYPQERTLSTIGGAILGLGGLLMGGIRGLFLMFFGGNMIKRGTTVQYDSNPLSDPPRVSRWHQFVQRQAAKAKQQPLVSDNPQQKIIKIE
jgi:uncharacterized membrane protein